MAYRRQPDARREQCSRGWGLIAPVVALTLLGSLSPARGFEPQGLPGSTWGQATYEAEGLTGPGIQGWVNQGIDWVTLPGDLILNTFGEFRYRSRSRNKTFFNAYGPAVGIEVRRSPFKLGADYYWERFPELGESSNRLQYYLSWYYEWDLKR